MYDLYKLYGFYSVASGDGDFNFGIIIADRSNYQALGKDIFEYQTQISRIEDEIRSILLTNPSLASLSATVDEAQTSVAKAQEELLQIVEDDLNSGIVAQVAE